MSAPVLSFRPETAGVKVDLDQLVATRMLLTANSGAGKSRMLRYLLEQTHGSIPQIVIDPEGEFASLRERFDYLLAGRDGDVPADPKTAKVLCRRIAELDRDELAELAGQSPTSSGYANNLGRLRSLGLIDYPRKGFVKITDLLRAQNAVNAAECVGHKLKVHENAFRLLTGRKCPVRSRAAVSETCYKAGEGER